MSTSTLNEPKSKKASGNETMADVFREVARNDFLKRKQDEQTRRANDILVPAGDALEQLLKELSAQVKVVRSSERVDHRTEALRMCIDLAEELDETLDRIHVQVTEATRPEI